MLFRSGWDFVRDHIDGMILLERKAWDKMKTEEQEQLTKISQKYNNLLESELEAYLKGKQT